MTILAHGIDEFLPLIIAFLCLLAGLLATAIVFWVRGLIRSSRPSLITGGLIIAGLLGFFFWLGGAFTLIHKGGLLLLPFGLATSIAAGWIKEGSVISKKDAAALGVLFMAIGLFSTMMLGEIL